MRLLLVEMGTLSPPELREQRLLLGLTEDGVADALLLSVAQVRGIETGSVAPFYNQGFYERARGKYVGLLTARTASATSGSSANTPARADALEPRMTLEDAPRGNLTKTDDAVRK